MQEDYKNTNEYKNVKKELLKRLKDRGIKSVTMTSKVNEYMDLWEARLWARDDLRERGLTITYKDSKGGLQAKKNDSAEIQLKYSLQMIKILQYLGIDPESLKVVVEDGTDL